MSPNPISGTPPVPTTCGRIPSHFSIALRFASILRSSIRSGEIFALCSLRDSASAFAAVTFCSASIFTLSKSLFALRASCSAVCFASIASVNTLEKLKATIEKASTSIFYLSSLSIKDVRIASLTCGLLVMSSSAEYLAETAFTTSRIAGSIIRSR